MQSMIKVYFLETVADGWWMPSNTTQKRGKVILNRYKFMWISHDAGKLFNNTSRQLVCFPT